MIKFKQAMKMRDRTENFEKEIFDILETGKIYISPYFNKRTCMEMMSFADEDKFDSEFEKAYKDNWESVLSGLRLAHARHLFLEYGIHASQAWKLSGFSSEGEMEKAINLHTY